MFAGAPLLMLLAMPHRPYRDEADLTLLLRWLSDHAPTTFMHPGDLVWWLYQNTQVDPRQALELFFDGEAGGNELQGFSYCDGSWSVLQGLPDLPAHVWDEMVAAAATRAGAQLTPFSRTSGTPLNWLRCNGPDSRRRATA